MMIGMMVSVAVVMGSIEAHILTRGPSYRSSSSSCQRLRDTVAVAGS